MITSRSRPSALRLAAGYGAIVSALPYLALKIVWIGGGTLGVADARVMSDATMIALNSITAGMDVVGIALALAFTHAWGSRIPAWLLLPPMWVATGLLTTFVLGVPIVATLSALAPDSLPRITGGPVEGWVYILVYIEFAGLGTGLILAFFLYARRRWADAFRPPLRDFQSAGSHRVHVALANATAPVAIALGVLNLAWAFGATIGLPQDAAVRRTIIGSVINGIDALLMTAAAAGVLILVHRVGGSFPRWLPLSMAWAGTGSMFGWGLWATINVLGETALMQATEGRAIVNLVGLLRMLVGLVMGLVTLFVIAEYQLASSQSPKVDLPPSPTAVETPVGRKT